VSEQQNCKREKATSRIAKKRAELRSRDKTQRGVEVKRREGQRRKHVTRKYTQESIE
jgi:hypothetical protein